MKISKHIFSFDDGCFDLLYSEMLTLGKKIHEKFKDIIVKNFYVFGVVDLILKKMVSDLLPFSIYCLAFFCQRGQTTAGKYDKCTRFFVDDNNFGSKIDKAFTFTFDRIRNTEISYLMNQVKTKSVSLYLYYVVGIFQRVTQEQKILEMYYVVGNFSKGDARTENLGELFFEVANNSFGLYVVYLQIYFKVFLICSG